jgi:zinc transport system substrate-binding protein
VANITQGITTPQLLVPDNQSPHGFALKPSQLRQLQQAHVVFYIHPQFETFLPKALGNLPNTIVTIPVAQNPHINLLEVREGGVWGQGHQHADGSTHAHHHHDTDYHIWLSPVNARAIAEQVATVLALQDPAHATQYQQNLQQFNLKLAALDQQLAATLQPVQNKAFMVFHDAYQYFEQHYQLHAVGAITLEPEQVPSAKRINALRNQLRERQVVCVFTEPQFSSRYVNVLLEGSAVRRATLDPLGVGVAEGTEAYFILMQNMAKYLLLCLIGSV